MRNPSVIPLRDGARSVFTLDRALHNHNNYSGCHGHILPARGDNRQPLLDPQLTQVGVRLVADCALGGGTYELGVLGQDSAGVAMG